MSSIQGDIQDLQPPVLQAWRQAQSALDQAKINYTLTSGYRSPEEQQHLLDLYHQGVPGIYHPAAVGQSPHQRGTALDIMFSGPGADQARGIMSEFGFVHSDPTDPPHFDFRGAGASQQGGQSSNPSVADAFLGKQSAPGLLGNQQEAPQSGAGGKQSSIADAFLGKPGALGGAQTPPSPGPSSSSPSVMYRGKPASDLENQAAGVAQKYGLDPAMFAGVIRTESSFNPDAVGPETRSGTAKGLGQFIDSTWAERGGGADVFDPTANLDASAHYLSDLMKQNGGDWNLALAAYNGATSHPAAARQYIGRVRSFASQYNTGGGSSPSASPPSSTSDIADAFLGSS